MGRDMCTSEPPLASVFDQAPGHVVLFEGPEHRIELAPQLAFIDIGLPGMDAPALPCASSP